MHPLRYTLYKILDGKKLRALSFHGRSQTMNIRQYSRVSLTISLSIYIFYNNHSHSRRRNALLIDPSIIYPSILGENFKKRLIANRNYPLNIFLEQTLSKRLGSLRALFGLLENKPRKEESTAQWRAADRVRSSVGQTS